MIHIAAIIFGVLVIAVIFGFFYVIHMVIRHFGMDTEEVLLTIFGGAVVLVVTWMLGTIALELLGVI